MRKIRQSCPDCEQESFTRRDFLKATSTLAGLAVLVSLDLSRSVQAADKEQTQPDQPGVEREKPLTIRGHHLFDMLGALGTGKSGLNHELTVFINKTPFAFSQTIRILCMSQDTRQSF